MNALKKLFSACLLVALCAAVGTSAAQAQFSITQFDGTFTKDDGTALMQAGDRSNWHLEFNFPSGTNPQGEAIPDGTVKRIAVELPPGLTVNPQAVPVCPEAKLLSNPNVGGLFSSCPPGSIVGLATAKMLSGDLVLPLANLQPSPGATAAFGFNVFGGIVKIQAITKEGGRKVYAVSEVPQTVQTIGTPLTFWGVPADESHDTERGGVGGFCGDELGVPSCPAEAPRVPLVSNPTDCEAGPLTATLEVNSWQEPERILHSTYQTHLLDGTPSGVTGCDALQFSPSMTVKPTSSEAAAPTGLEVEISLPQSQDPDGLSTAQMKKTVTVLPPGMVVNASQANGVGACSEEQFGLLNNNPVTCPDSSKIGSTEIVTPLLAEPLKGGVYLAQQGSNPFNSTLALYLLAENPERGVIVKLAGKVSPDPQTGQLTTTFDDSPQSPFETLRLRLDGGDRAALVNPPTCGRYVTHAELTSYARQNVPVESDSSFEITSGCGRNAGFTPGFQAGTVSPLAGTFSPFTMRVTRPDGQPNVNRIEAKLPEGVLAKIAGVGVCSDAGAATGDCPASSQVGTAIVGSGAGASPVYVPQPGRPATAVYLAGPYKGAPYSVVVKVPAQAGPFDLGTVAVRNALQVDPSTSQVTVQSDPLPQILLGIPVTYRDIRVNVSRPDFTTNPTNCEPMSVDGTIGSATGGEAKLSDRFQVANCANLGFAPQLSLKVSGATKRGGYPALRAVLKAKPGQANIGRVSVALPHSEFLAQEHIKTICTRVQYAADACPAGSIYGYAKATTPLLEKPLEGPVYLRSSSNKLPDLVAALHGQIDIDLAGRIDSVRGGIRNTFDLVPDAPVTEFTLTMQGGKKGLLVNSRNLCTAPNKAVIQMDGQNGKLSDTKPLLANSCKKKSKSKKAKGKSGRR